MDRVATYTAIGVTKALALTGGQLAAIKALSLFGETLDAAAAARIEVDLSNIPMGHIAMVEWQGKPVFIFHRNDSQIRQAQEGDSVELRHKETDAERRKGPEQWMIVVGICTHLGCIPLTMKGDFDAFFCPCHGSHYDSSGRIRVGPAPLNLEVPRYSFLDEKTILLG